MAFILFFHAENCPGTASWLADHGAATEKSTVYLLNLSPIGERRIPISQHKVRAHLRTGTDISGKVRSVSKIPSSSEISTMLLPMLLN